MTISTPMKGEKEIIESAREALVQALFSTFFQSYTCAMGDRAQEVQAEQLFCQGVRHARFVRDRAIALLP